MNDMFDFKAVERVKKEKKHKVKVEKRKGKGLYIAHRNDVERGRVGLSLNHEKNRGMRKSYPVGGKLMFLSHNASMLAKRGCF